MAKLIRINKRNSNKEYVLILSEGESVEDYLPEGCYVAEEIEFEDPGSFPTDRLLEEV